MELEEPPVPQAVEEEEPATSSEQQLLQSTFDDLLHLVKDVVWKQAYAQNPQFAPTHDTCIRFVLILTRQRTCSPRARQSHAQLAEFFKAGAPAYSTLNGTLGVFLAEKALHSIITSW